MDRLYGEDADMRPCRPEPLLIALAVVVGRVACVSVDTPAVLSISPGEVAISRFIGAETTAPLRGSYEICAERALAFRLRHFVFSAGACAGIEVDGLSARFSYEAQFNSISEATCSDRIRCHSSLKFL